MMATVLGSWFDLRSRSLANSKKIDHLDKELNERISAAEMRISAVDLKVETHKEKFQNYQVSTARDFVTFDQFNVIKRELVEEIRGLRELLEKRRDQKHD